MAGMLGILLAMALALGLFIVVNRKAPNGLLRPFIDLVQKVTVMLMFDAPFPKALTDLYRVLAGMSLGIEVASPQCAGVGSNYYATFGWTVLCLLLIVAALLIRPVENARIGHRPPKGGYCCPVAKAPCPTTAAPPTPTPTPTAGAAATGPPWR